MPETHGPFCSTNCACGQGNGPADLPGETRTLRELIAKWRDEVTEYPTHIDKGLYAATAVRMCANELEAALLASSPAPAAPLASLERLRGKVADMRTSMLSPIDCPDEQTSELADLLRGAAMYHVMLIEEELAALLDPPGRPAHERTEEQAVKDTPS